MKKWLLIIALPALLLALTACGARQSAAAASLTDGLRPQAVAKTDLSESQRAAMSKFAAGLFNEVLAQDKQNPVISPLSAYVALAMTAGGAQGETAEEFAAMLGMPTAELGAACAALSERLSGSGDKTELLLANSLWLDKRLIVERDFLQHTVDYYRAEVFNCNFKSANTVNEVNGWIESQTKGLIKNMLAEINEDAALLLVNALYMNAEWQVPFKAEDTLEDVFTTGQGLLVRTDYLRSVGPRQCVFTDDWEGVLLPYDDGQLAFLAVRPTAGKIRDISLDAATLRELAGGAQEYHKVVLEMPKFEAEYELDLKEPLIGMGLISAFDSARADFSALGYTEEGGLFIEKVLQKVLIKVNEKGTEAAAATVVMMMAGSAMPEPEEIVYLTLDTPYLYAVVELESGMPLFMGLMENPKP